MKLNVSVTNKKNKKAGLEEVKKRNKSWIRGVEGVWRSSGRRSRKEGGHGGRKDTLLKKTEKKILVSNQSLNLYYDVFYNFFLSRGWFNVLFSFVNS